MDTREEVHASFSAFKCNNILCLGNLCGGGDNGYRRVEGLEVSRMVVACNERQ